MGLNKDWLIELMKKSPLQIFFGNILYNKFARNLGFDNYNEMMVETFHIFTIPPDGSFYATRKQDGSWAVWNDEGLPPYSIIEFDDWEKAIMYLRSEFESRQYPEELWCPIGYDEEDDEFKIPPDKNKAGW